MAFDRQKLCTRHTGAYLRVKDTDLDTNFPNKLKKIITKLNNKFWRKINFRRKQKKKKTWELLN